MDIIGFSIIFDFQAAKTSLTAASAAIGKISGKEKVVVPAVLTEIIEILKISVVNNAASPTRSNHQTNIPRPYLLKSPGIVSINLEAALLVRSVLDFFLEQMNIAPPDERHLIRKHCVEPIYLILNGPLTSLFINSALSSTRNDQLYKIFNDNFF